MSLLAETTNSIHQTHSGSNKLRSIPNTSSMVEKQESKSEWDESLVFEHYVMGEYSAVKKPPMQPGNDRCYDAWFKPDINMWPQVC